MKTRKLVGSQHLPQHLPQKMNPSRLAPKRKLNQVRSQDTKYRSRPLNPQPQPQLQPQKPPKQQTYNPAFDYDFQRRERQTLNYIPIGQSIQIQENQPNFRSQRNSHSRQFLQLRENNFVNNSNTRSHQSSGHRIKIFSIEKQDHSASRSQRSDNSSCKRRTGIELTKTLLKRISGMYNDKDFQNKSSYIKSSREQTTGMTKNMSERVQDEYQLSDFDFQIQNNNTLNSSYNKNQFSFNESGSWHRSSERVIEPEQRILESAYWKGTESSKWNNNDSPHQVKGNQSGHLKRHERNSGFQHKVQICVPKNNYKISHQNEEQILKVKEKPRISFNSSSSKQLPKVKSYGLLTSDRPISQSIEIGGELPIQEAPRRRHLQASPADQRYVIRSKNKTLQQLSVKQSMVLGFDSYYQ